MWDITNPDNQPEDFAATMVSDLGLIPQLDYSLAISYEIRKQIQIYICRKVQGFCNVWENYVQARVEDIGDEESDRG